MSEIRRRQPKYRHVAPAVALMTTVVVAMTGITISRLSRIPVERVSAPSPAVVRVRLVGVQRAEAAPDAAAREAAARDAAARVSAAAALSAGAPEAADQDAAPATAPDATPAAVVEAESPTLPLSPATLMVGLAAARSRALASASPRPAPGPECENAVVQNFDADIVGMTGVPGRKLYYGRTQKSASAAACRRMAQTASSTP